MLRTWTVTPGIVSVPGRTISKCGARNPASRPAGTGCATLSGSAGVAERQTQRTQNAPGQPVGVRISPSAPRFTNPPDSRGIHCVPPDVVRHRAGLGGPPPRRTPMSPRRSGTSAAPPTGPHSPDTRTRQRQHRRGSSAESPPRYRRQPPEYGCKQDIPLPRVSTRGGSSAHGACFSLAFVLAAEPSPGAHRHMDDPESRDRRTHPTPRRTNRGHGCRFSAAVSSHPSSRMPRWREIARRS